MSQTGQNSAVRTRDEQIKLFGDMVEELGNVSDNSYGWVRREIEAAEARGAEEQRRKAVAAEREKNDALIRSLAVGYERMRGVLCTMAATSGSDTSWYRNHAERGLYSVPAIWDIAQNPVEAKPGECSWINREGSLEAIRSAAK